MTRTDSHDGANRDLVVYATALVSLPRTIQRHTSLSRHGSAPFSLSKCACNPPTPASPSSCFFENPFTSSDCSWDSWTSEIIVLEEVMMSSRRPAVRAGLRRAAKNALTGGIARTHVLTAPASAAGTHFTAESSPLNTWRAARKVVQVHAGMLPRTLGGAGKSGEADGIWGTSRGGNVEDSRRDVVVRGIWAFLPTDLGKHVKQLAGTR